MGLVRYTVRRLLQAIPVLLGVVTITFALANAIPGDPVQIMLGPSPSQSEIAAIRARYGLDQPLWVRYVNYVAALLTGDLGTSIYYDVAVTRKIGERLPATVLLMLSSYAFAIATAIPLGVVSAKRRNRLTDHVSRIVSLIGVSTPSFWIGLMLILVFGFHTNLLPTTNLVMPWADPAGIRGAETRLDVLAMAGEHLLLPMITLGTLQMAAITRIERSEMLDVLTEEYVTLARAYGISERTILRKHAFRNAQLPVITIIGLQLSSAIGGAVLTEVVFEINGMGRLIVDSIARQDYPLIMGTTIVFAFVFVVGVVVTDLSYAYVDPRVSYGEAE
ncbi:ABC transporter permease [Halomicrobium sp. HM KBTZ05]|uniref:ABC transporter permease subunit n=1 Tax=Halomicrobium mukohataei TaxID=57705 RepID=A0A847UFN1_9EURY|nr:ABC transporter permease [Halomicrobium mukohataei]NLV09888.1 ABC transporter permease subunit [Halomicrobium mukohataei]